MHEHSAASEIIPSWKNPGYVSFVATIEAHAQYLVAQCDQGYISYERLEVFQKKITELQKKYQTEQVKALQEFNHEREKILQDTGIELLKERSIAGFQQELYSTRGIDRYTYKNDTAGRFIKGMLDATLFDMTELFVLLRDQ